MSTFRTLDDADLKGKRALVRVDLNVPMENGRVTDLTRLERIVPTLTTLADGGAKVIILAHFGRPKGVDPTQSLKAVVPALAEPVRTVVAPSMQVMVVFVCEQSVDCAPALAGRRQSAIAVEALPSNARRAVEFIMCGLS